MQTATKLLLGLTLLSGVNTSLLVAARAAPVAAQNSPAAASADQLSHEQQKFEQSLTHQLAQPVDRLFQPPSAESATEQGWFNRDLEEVDSADDAQFQLRLGEKTAQGTQVALYAKDNVYPRILGYSKTVDGERVILSGPYQIYDYDPYKGEGSRYLRDVGEWDSKGHYHGLRQLYNSLGQLRFAVQYEHGRKQGFEVRYYDNGQIKRRLRWENDSPVDGEVITYSPSGEIAERTHYKNGDKNGKAVEYYDNGQIKSELSYRNGDWFGERKTYFESGELASIATYNEKGIYGEHIRYNQSGQVVLRESYRDDKRHGPSERYYDNGQQQEELHYRDGERAGEWRYWYENGQLRIHSHYDEQGQLIDEKHFRKDGTLEKRISFYQHADYGRVKLTENFDRDKNKTREVHFNRAERWVLRQQFDDQGELKLRDESIKGHRVGEFISASWGGQTRYQHYQDGKLNGPYRVENADGDIVEEGQYKAGKSVGEWRTMDHDKSWITRHYNAQGQLHGETRKVNAEGDLLYVENYQQGELHGDYRYPDHGDGFREGQYQQGKRDGQWRLQDSKYSPIWQGRYQQGKRVGEWLAYTAAGYLTHRKHYNDNGRLDGRRIVFSEDGALKQVEHYSDGKHTGLQLYYYKAQLNAKYRYDDEGQLVDKKTNLSD